MVNKNYIFALCSQGFLKLLHRDLLSVLDGADEKPETFRFGDLSRD